MSSPSRSAARAVTAALTAELVAVALLVAAWYGASGRVRVEDQLAWAALAAGGLVLAGAANAAFLVAARRRLRFRRLAFEAVARPAAFQELARR